MKIKVIGWTDSYDTHFCEGEHSFAANEAIIEDIRTHGYEFTGWDHQERSNCVPVLSDGTVRSFSQRGWGGIMASAHGFNGPMDYCRYAFDQWFPPEDCVYPDKSREITSVVKSIAKKYLTDGQMDELFNTPHIDWAVFPRKKGVGELDIVKIEAETGEDGELSPFYLLPKRIFEELIETSPYEEFSLTEEECTFFIPPVKTFDRKLNIVYLEGKDLHVKLIDRPNELKYIANGDTVRIGDKTYEVAGVNRYHDVPEKIRNRASYHGIQDEEYKRAREQLEASPVLLDLTLKK